VTPHWQSLLTTDALPGASSHSRALGSSGSLSYFKRFKMEADLDRLPALALPEGFYWLSWYPGLIETHAELLYGCFYQEIDAVVFASLGDRDGCRRLMSEIVRKNGFLPQATWLLACPSGFCGTVQGIRERKGVGAIQNLGILPGYRGRGLGAQLLLQAMHGFRQAGLQRTLLEVTAQNERAIRIYRRLGFRRVKTLYKAVATPLC
jgi:ribosomal protein S18 acetylase RimI-like enzyme